MVPRAIDFPRTRGEWGSVVPSRSSKHFATGFFAMHYGCSSKAVQFPRHLILSPYHFYLVLILQHRSHLLTVLYLLLLHGSIDCKYEQLWVLHFPSYTLFRIQVDNKIIFCILWPINKNKTVDEMHVTKAQCEKALQTLPIHFLFLFLMLKNQCIVKFQQPSHVSAR